MKDQEHFYQELVEQVKDYDGEKADIIGLAPALFRFLTDISQDDDIPTEGKSLVKGAIGYFVAPYDGLPEEALGPLGFMDDIFVCLHVIRTLSETVENDLLEEHWSGEGLLQSTVDRIYPDVEAYLHDHAKHVLTYVDFLIQSSQ